MMNIKQTFGCLRQFRPAYPGIFSIALFLLMSSALVFAQPPLLGDPDITLSGNDFNKISGYHDGPAHIGDPGDEGIDGCTWYPNGDAIFTSWDNGGPANHFGHCLWVMYVVELDAGYWRIGLNAINHRPGLKDHQWYPWFEVLVELGHTTTGSAVVFVPASDEEIKPGFQWFHIPEDGLYGVKFTWLNDKSECANPPDCTVGYDANIRIDSVFFDKQTALERPTGIRATDGTFTDRVRVTFDLVAGATVYRVFRCPDKGYTCGLPIGYPKTGTFDDSSGDPGTVYYYRVRACSQNTCGRFSVANAGHRGG